MLFIRPDDLVAGGVEEGQIVAADSDAGDGRLRRRECLIVTPYDIPRGCFGAQAGRLRCDIVAENLHAVLRPRSVDIRRENAALRSRCVNQPVRQIGTARPHCPASPT